MPSLDISPHGCRPARQQVWRKLIAGLALSVCLPLASLEAQQAPANIKNEDLIKVLGLPEGYDNSAIEDLRKGFSELLSGRIDDAIEKFADAEKTDRTLAPPNVLVARVFAAANRMDQAKVRLEIAAIENDDSPDVYLTFARLALGEGRLTDALLQFEQARAAKTKSTTDTNSEDYKAFEREVLGGLTRIDQQRNAWAKAEKHAQFWLDSSKDGPKDAQAAAELALGTAKFLQTDKETNDAREKAAETHIENAVKLNADAAKDDPTKALGSPKVILAQLALKKAGDPKTTKPEKYTKMAEKYFTDAIAAPSGDKKADAVVESFYSRYLLGKNEIKEAQAHAEKATQLDPTSDAFKQVMGIIDLRQKNFKEAANIFNELYQKSPSDFFASNNLALALIGMGDEPTKDTNRKKAEELATVNARANSKSPEALSTLGWIYYQEGRIQDAEQMLQAAVSNNQASLDTAYYLANVYAARGQLNEAAKLLAQALQSAGPFTYREEAETWFKSLTGRPGVTVPASAATPSSGSGSSTKEGSGSSTKEKDKPATPAKPTTSTNK